MCVCKLNVYLCYLFHLGYYCPLGTKYATEYPCPLGTWSDISGLGNVSDCTPCPGGYYCDQQALTAYSKLCTEGYVIIVGIKIWGMVKGKEWYIYIGYSINKRISMCVCVHAFVCACVYTCVLAHTFVDSCRHVSVLCLILMFSLPEK